MGKRVYLAARDLVFRSKLGAVAAATGAETVRDSDACDVADTAEAFVAKVIERIATGLPDEQRAARERLKLEGWAEKAKQFELTADYPLAGETWHQRTVIQTLSPDTMIATSYLSFGAVPAWKGVEIKYTRRAK